MADDTGITINAEEFLRKLDLYNDLTRRAIYGAMKDNAFDLWKEAGKLAPVHKGRLIDSISATRPQWTGRTTIEARVGANVEYAATVHETMEPAIAVRTMRPGETTRAKPPTRFGKAGGKYLERPLIGKAKEYTEHIADKVRAV